MNDCILSRFFSNFSLCPFLSHSFIGKTSTVKLRCERDRQRLRAEVEALSQRLAAQEEELAAGLGLVPMGGP